MFDRIIAYSIRQKLVIGVLVLGLIGWGLYSLRSLPIDALPDITNNQVQIITTSPNLATQEIERFITYPIELAVKSIPKIVELRSVSRFGLSIVTVVFEEHVDIYWARAQITERLKQAEDDIPAGYGRPELAPISTGLGEIYQYTVSAQPGYEDTFDIMELRSIQDWMIVPQLLGTRGVAEVNTLGGLLKEYEVAVDPDRLRSMHVTMAEIFDALDRNNENTGGAYIDKKPYAYFIRSIGMVNSLEDIQRIVVKTHNGIPILIRDVADVGFGHSIRYGATTQNGQGEVVNGMVMMLKGENSAAIIQLIKDKMEQIKTTLPEGVVINPYLDRSKLVHRAISTVRTNLIEGALIVIFVLVLLIGNWRAGLIVASVIPLSLLFAFSMMRLFNVSGNLMSLGAIDFGLIVDGAVIIVEAIVHRLQNVRFGRKLSMREMNEQVYQAASKIRGSAAFGEIIILIVYLPILALVGIEGKMFKPMAQTVSFAILGAFILSLTYVPMMCALCLQVSPEQRRTLSDRIMAFFQRLYAPVLRFALRAKIAVLLLAAVLFVIAFLTFRSLGGEFIPTLDEGDIATHIIIPPGSSLEQEIETTTRAEQLVLAQFPEVEQVVSKIGSSEIPTDPMPIEVADLLVIFKDKSEWTSARSMAAMQAKMEEVLDGLPGVTTEFSQPIQMRFNELMTGIRSDVGVKIFGDDVERLVSLGEQATAIVQSVEGVVDARAEAVTGLKQITVNYDKDKLALYGLTISDLNHTVRMGFAGAKAGVVYEGERMYDLVIRLAEAHRQDISHIQNLYITLPSGNQIPLDQVADIRFERGPAQISREDGRRRVIIGFNVRGRDVASVVREIQSKFEEDMSLPTGYYITYAGQFENLTKANRRLSVAVPIALALIFILLYFTFNSVVQSFLIFTAIPLSAIGGVFALWLRDMPFSISAGIGFIALFGVAVLNGIVLIAYFNQLKAEGVSDVVERIKKGTHVRLRPVIMTAAVASLGFLPMALSTSAGAEVQKPLATVVIGGLITSTLLTLIVLPVLYYYSERARTSSKTMGRGALSVILIGLTAIGLTAQPVANSLTLDAAIEKAISSNRGLAASKMNVTKHQQLRQGAATIPKTDFRASFGQLNTRSIDQSYAVAQQFNPFVFKAQKALSDARIEKSMADYEVDEQALIYQVRHHWNALLFHQSQRALLEEQEGLWRRFSDYARRKYETGEASLLEQTTAHARHEALQIRLQQNASDVQASMLHLKALMHTSDDFRADPHVLVAMEGPASITASTIEGNAVLRATLQESLVAEADQHLRRAEAKPDFSLGYFIQSIRGDQEVDGRIVRYDATPRFHGVSIGLGLPIFGRSYKAKIRAAETEMQMREARADRLRLELENERLRLLDRLQSQQAALDYYTDTALPNADRITTSAQRAYEGGDISYVEYLQALESQFDIRAAHLKAVRDFNDTTYALRYLLDQ